MKWEDWIYEFGRAYRGEHDFHLDRQTIKVLRWLHRLHYSPQYAAEVFDQKYSEYYEISVLAPPLSAGGASGSAE